MLPLGHSVGQHLSVQNRNQSKMCMWSVNPAPLLTTKTAASPTSTPYSWSKVAVLTTNHASWRRRTGRSRIRWRWWWGWWWCCFPLRMCRRWGPRIVWVMVCDDCVVVEFDIKCLQQCDQICVEIARLGLNIVCTREVERVCNGFETVWHVFDERLNIRRYDLAWNPA